MLPCVVMRVRTVDACVYTVRVCVCVCAFQLVSVSVCVQAHRARESSIIAPDDSVLRVLGMT